MRKVCEVAKAEVMKDSDFPTFLRKSQKLIFKSVFFYKDLYRRSLFFKLLSVFWRLLSLTSGRFWVQSMDFWVDFTGTCWHMPQVMESKRHDLKNMILKIYRRPFFFYLHHFCLEGSETKEVVNYPKSTGFFPSAFCLMLHAWCS